MGLKVFSTRSNYGVYHTYRSPNDPYDYRGPFDDNGTE